MKNGNILSNTFRVISVNDIYFDDEIVVNNNIIPNSIINKSKKDNNKNIEQQMSDEVYDLINDCNNMNINTYYVDKNNNKNNNNNKVKKVRKIIKNKR